jgi:hypothetical protein
MNRRTTLVLTGMALLGLAAAALPDLGFAQSNPLIGTWKLNLDKSKFSPGTAPRSGTLNYQQDGQNIRNTGQFTVSGLYSPPTLSAADGRTSDLESKGWTHVGHRAFAQI